MTVIASSNYVRETVYDQNTNTQSSNSHKHKVNAEFKYVGDSYVCTNKKDIAKWLECAKTNGTCNGITYHPAESHFFGLIKSKAKYSYITKAGDTPQSVREMFNLKPGALREYDDYIFDVNEPYEAGKTIYFSEESINPISSLTIL